MIPLKYVFYPIILLHTVELLFASAPDPQVALSIHCYFLLKSVVTCRKEKKSPKRRPDLPCKRINYIVYSSSVANPDSHENSHLHSFLCHCYHLPTQEASDFFKNDYIKLFISHVLLIR